MAVTPAEEPRGILAERVELKDISLPKSMKRSMPRQAEAERERRARVIAADGGYRASTRLAEAAGDGRRPRPALPAFPALTKANSPAGASWPGS